jgi:aspartate/methionine/tyrosine aminotransferase
MTVSRLREIRGIGVDRTGDSADAAHDPEILRLENMDTDLAPPPEAISATHEAISRDDCNSYLPFTGHASLRQAAAAHVSRLSGVFYDWNRQCVISVGGLAGILNTLFALLEPGDEVIAHDPIYVGLLNRIRLAGGVPKFVALEPTSEGWSMDTDSLERAASPRTRVVLMVNPSFPSGAVLTLRDWTAIAEFCRSNNTWLVYDAALERILYDGHPYIHPASLPGMADLTITVGCVSKEYRMIGWRVGWIVGPSPILADIARVSMANVVCQVGIAMPGAEAALMGSDAGVSSAIAEWQRRRDLMMEELAGLPAISPGGGWCLLMDTRKLGLDPHIAAQQLLERGKVATTPMNDWGSERAGAYLRFVFANEPIVRLRSLRDRIRRAWRT